MLYFVGNSNATIYQWYSIPFRRLCTYLPIIKKFNCARVTHIGRHSKSDAYAGRHTLVFLFHNIPLYRLKKVSCGINIKCFFFFVAFRSNNSRNYLLQYKQNLFHFLFIEKNIPICNALNFNTDVLLYA